MPADQGNVLALEVIDQRAEGLRVATGTFGAHMRVHLVNDGPVTLVMDV